MNLDNYVQVGAQAITARFTNVPFDSLDVDVQRDALDEASDVLQAVIEKLVIDLRK